MKTPLSAVRSVTATPDRSRCETAHGVLRTLVLAIGVFVSAGTFASAQSPAPGALPTAPGAAEKAGQGGYTAARASLPGDNGNPLEPYLFLFILAGGGVVAWVLAVSTDIRLQRQRRR